MSYDMIQKLIDLLGLSRPHQSPGRQEIRLSSRIPSAAPVPTCWDIKVNGWPIEIIPLDGAVVPGDRLAREPEPRCQVHEAQRLRTVDRAIAEIVKSRR
jgi:hypothetical protein